MDRSEWIGRLELLHANLRRGAAVSEEDREWYLRARDRFLAVAVDQQNATIVGSERRRQAIRIDRAVPVRLGGAGWSLQATTVDLAVGGFAVHARDPIPRDKVSWCDLDVPGATLRLPVRIVRAVPADGQVRVSFRFADPPADAVRMLEDYILDQVLPTVVFWDTVLDRIRD